MPKILPDITGFRFGRLIATRFHGRLPHGNAHTLAWECNCECGGTKIAARPELMAGKIVSCGCYNPSRTHGKTKTPGYYSYIAMVNRCENHKSKDFFRYGALGIRVCSRWLEGDGTKSGIECFFDDMGVRPSDGMSIDRIDGSKGYYPENCRWARATTQARNTRRNYFKDGRDVKAFLEANGIPYGRFRNRIAAGWTIEEALTLPKRAFRDPASVSVQRRARTNGKSPEVEGPAR